MKKILSLTMSAMLLCSSAAAMAEATYCNPLTLPNLQIQPKPFFKIPETEDQINYKVEIAQEMLAKDTWIAEKDGRTLSSVGNVLNPVDDACRTAADPTAFFHDGVCYLYATGDCVNNVNCWYTTDFAEWIPFETDGFPTAPSIVEVNNKFYVAGNGSKVYQSDSPMGPWTELGNFVTVDGVETNGFSDVCFFLDDDGRLYLTYGIGCPTMGVELDPDNPTQFITEPVSVFDYDTNRAWTHAGSDFQDFTYGTCEGGQIFKYRGNYYFQTSSNGTDNASYCIGILRSDNPLGPYVEQPNNPVTTPCSGMMEGAGHGLFVENPENGALLLFYTSIVGHVSTWYGRRVSMDVCSIDADGNISVNRTERPQIVPSALSAGCDSYNTDAGLYNLSKWMSYWTNNTENKVSGYLAIDDSMSTWWTPTEEEPVYISGFGGVFNLHGVQICWKEFGFDFTRHNAMQYTIQYMNIETGEWDMLVDKSENTVALVEEYIPLEKPVMTCAIRVDIKGCTDGSKVGITELRAFGENYTIAAEHGIDNYMVK